MSDHVSDSSRRAAAPPAEPSRGSEGDPRFGVALTCIDGRVHEPLLRWVREHAGVDHVDLVTEPGADSTLASCRDGACGDMRRRLQVSIDAHGPQLVAIVGHDDCAANPVGPDRHREQIRSAVAEVQGWARELEVVGVWISADRHVEAIDARGDDGPR